jgi:hypothetical protein
MKKTIAIIVSLIFVLSFAGLSFAADKPAVEKKAEPVKAEKKAPAMEEKKAEKKASVKTMSVSGNVTAVDAKAGTLSVKGKMKGDVVLIVDAKTKVVMGKDVKTLTDIKVGDKVQAKYSGVDNKNVAKKVEIMPAKAAEKKAEPAKTEKK